MFHLHEESWGLVILGEEAERSFNHLDFEIIKIKMASVQQNESKCARTDLYSDVDNAAELTQLVQ